MHMVRDFLTCLSKAQRQHQELSTDELLRISQRPRTLRKALLAENEGDASSSGSSAGEASTSNETSSSQDAQITDEEMESIFSIMPTERVPLGTKSIANQTEGQAKESTSSFSALGISAPLQAALTAMSIKVPTEVQRACIPPLLAGE